MNRSAGFSRANLVGVRAGDVNTSYNRTPTRYGPPPSSPGFYRPPPYAGDKRYGLSKAESQNSFAAEIAKLGAPGMKKYNLLDLRCTNRKVRCACYASKLMRHFVRRLGRCRNTDMSLLPTFGPIQVDIFPAR